MQTDSIVLSRGRLSLRTFGLRLPEGVTGDAVVLRVSLGGQAVPVEKSVDGPDLMVRLSSGVTLTPGQMLEVSARW
jgi:hypothetical protein